MLKKNLLLLMVSVCLLVTANAQKAEKVSLIVKYVPDNSNRERETVISLDFVGGKLVGKRELFSVDTNVTGDVNGIYLDRYVLTNNETIFSWKPENEKTFDLKTGKFVERKTVPLKKMTEPASYDLISPDGKKSIKRSFSFGGVDSLTIAIAGQRDLVINESFDVTTSEISSFRPSLPIEWIDNERILTQRMNGVLVIITLDGKVMPFLEIPACTTDGSPSLRTNKIGKLIYACDGEEYRIDVRNRTYTRINFDLDYGFSRNLENNQSVIYYKEKKIGVGGASNETFPNYFAMPDGKPDSSGNSDSASYNQIKIWDRYTEKWQTVMIDGFFTEILGWFR